jgi:hypothetical protein
MFIGISLVFPHYDIIISVIIVHDIFVCKPGNASKAAKMFKETMGKDPHALYIMTDMTGQFHRVVMVSQYKDLAEYGKSLEAYANPPPEMKEAMKEMKDFQEMYIAGSREIYRTW